MRKLIINADDFGMCNSINIGILECFLRRKISQVSIMPTAPYFSEAIQLVKDYKIPCGIHLTLASEWDLVKWKPITDAKTIVDEDGFFLPHVNLLKNKANNSEIKRELENQIVKVMDYGIVPTHLDSHIEVYNWEIIEELSTKYQIISRELLIRNSICNLFHLSISGDCWKDKLSSLIKYLNCLDNKIISIIVCHPSIPGSDLSNLCSSKWEGRKKWSLDIRISDYECLLNSKPSLLNKFKLINFKYFGKKN